ncbi:MAG TPA: class I SAM-dependent methyltransferase [Rhodanobacter sp.]|nr:class I SAM-dependent methyltransferase [Rhodanobacter sp.]
MNVKLKGLISDLVPPIVLRGLAAVIAPRHRSASQVEPSGEKGAEWYDASFDACEHWTQHYTESEYYFLWSVIADRVVRTGARSILEIGCGTGQLACLIRDKTTCKYIGFDFSQKRIQYAKQTYPGLSFVQQDAFQTDLFTTCDYDTVVCTEFLEHIEDDRIILNRIRKGTRFYGTVPNFPFVSHVRHFHDENEVQSRYAGYFHDLRVDKFLADAKGKAFYLLDGEIL